MFLKGSIWILLCFEIVSAAVLKELLPLERPTWLMDKANIDLKCETTDSSPIDWLKDGATVLNDQRFKVSSKFSTVWVSELVVTMTTVADAGVYTCKMRNGTEKLEITVKFLQLRVQAAHYEKGKNATMTVMPINLSGADKKSCSISWFKNNTKSVTLDSTHVLNTVNNSYTLTAPTRKDLGEYKCEFRFNVKNVEDLDRQAIIVQPVNFNAKPYITKHYKSKNLVEGDILMLECEASGYPLPSISWFKDSEELFNGNRTTIADLVKDDTTGTIFVRDGLLTVKDLTFDDRADYVCVATNEFGSYNSTITLRVKDKLAALWPFLAIVCEVVILCVIIFIYEKKKSKELDAAAAAHLNGKHDVPHDKKASKEDVRLRKS